MNGIQHTTQLSALIARTAYTRLLATQEPWLWRDEYVLRLGRLATSGGDAYAPEVRAIIAQMRDLGDHWNYESSMANFTQKWHAGQMATWAAYAAVLWGMELWCEKHPPLLKKAAGNLRFALVLASYPPEAHVGDSYSAYLLPDYAHRQAAAAAEMRHLCGISSDEAWPWCPA